MPCRMAAFASCCAAAGAKAPVPGRRERQSTCKTNRPEITNLKRNVPSRPSVSTGTVARVSRRDGGGTGNTVGAENKMPQLLRRSWGIFVTAISRIGESEVDDYFDAVACDLASRTAARKVWADAGGSTLPVRADRAETSGP